MSKNTSYTIYNNVRSNQLKELSFLNWLCNNLDAPEVIKEHFPLNDSLASKTLKPLEIAKKIQKNHFIPLKKKANCIRTLLQLPKEIRLVSSIKGITVDFAIVSNGQVQFIEFHEKQHRSLSNQKPSNVYTLEGDIIKVPRYLQRLLRDIWRMKYLPNYKVVWYDWFELSNNIDIFNTNKVEFALQGNFKISELNY
ncbi:hypothetical protein [Mangrovimonas sp. DI 80]|uniref:hypothetical protein n=1 Tax=Mangrovimonas sp. DI 80 TaxID=1779330 RepID=UPI0009771863|nr:hypothetical protein [Mangrovimonas sp. DI 80]OMP29694.1 hypothetical protein BKM32_16220 [Mangrovimonas sp. DI 80]